jgi:hypothetical protein
MLVPVHQRGAIQLPGGTTAANSKDSCCHKSDSHSSKDSKKSRDNCAVCHFVAGLHTPPPAMVVESRPQLLRDLPVESGMRIVPRHAALPFHGLDPPVV